MKKKNLNNIDPTKLRLFHDNVLIEAFEIESKDGIVNPSSYEDKPELGVVLSVGPGRVLESGEVISPQVKKNDIVLFNKYSPVKINVDGRDFYVVREEDIVGAT